VATGQEQRVSRQLGTLLAVGTAGELTDGQLLERFATRTGEAAEQAFATLVERHGPMVLRVCRGVLFDPNDVEDAFQATFLVLVNKARSLWVSDSLGPWLHQVALRTASCARSTAARRQRHERGAAVSVRASHAVSHDDLGQVLHEEIDRLPERFRLSVILCDLEGNTHEQAARHLGWPVGTVKSRLTRARKRLRDRLTRRGLSPGAGVITLLRPGVMEDLLPGALVQATASAAVRFGASRTLLGGSAAILAQGVLTAMSMTRWWKAASLLLVATATVSSAGILSGKGTMAVAARPQASAKPVPGGDVPVEEVKAGKFNVNIVANGLLESSKREEVQCQVEGRTTILSILPEGTKVRKGDLVAELDSASLRDQLTNQRITTRSTEAAFQNARLTREVAEIAVREYEEGIFLQDKATCEGEIKLAESANQKAKARLERTRRARTKLTGTLNRKEATTTSGDILAELDIEDRIESAEQALLRETFSLEKAQYKLHVLLDYTKGKTIKELRTEVEKARSDELAKQATWELEKNNVAKLERQIASCKIYAPADGIVYSAMGTGVATRERGKVMEIHGASLKVSAVVEEGVIGRLKVGQKAAILVSAFPNERFSGVVTDVARTHVLSTPPGSQLYAVTIKLDKSPDFLRPGMVSKAQLSVGGSEDVLTVPVQAVLRSSGKSNIAVKKSDGGFEWREVVLGETNGSRVEIKQGLKPFEEVALDPLTLVREGLNHEKNPEPTRPR
jgi:HlyD family secretion protein